MKFLTVWARLAILILDSRFGHFFMGFKRAHPTGCCSVAEILGGWIDSLEIGVTFAGMALALDLFGQVKTFQYWALATLTFAAFLFAATARIKDANVQIYGTPPPIHTLCVFYTVNYSVLVLFWTNFLSDILRPFFTFVWNTFWRVVPCLGMIIYQLIERGVSSGEDYI